MVCSSKPLKMDGSVIFLEHLVYRIYFSFIVCSVQCLYKDGYPFAIFLDKTLGMGIYDRLLFQVASVSESPVEYFNNLSVGLIWWREVSNSALLSKAAQF